MTRKCLLALVLSLGLVVPGRGADPGGGSGVVPLRFAFSAQMFTDVNENDAKASVKAWALALARERGVAMDTQPVILSGLDQLREAVTALRIDGAAVTTEEYLSLDPSQHSTNLFVSVIEGRKTEEYLVVVRADSAYTGLANLRGKALVVFDSPRTSLAPLWLEVSLAENQLEVPARHFGRMTRATKLSKVVLPVFFRQADACLVSRRGFETMSELNPQVRAQMRILATSPGYVPALGFIRSGYNTPLRDDLLRALRHLEGSVAGAQVLTLFQSDELIEVSPAVLDSARDLLATHRRLSRGDAAAEPARRPPQ